MRDLRKFGVRVVARQEGSDSAQLFAKLAVDAGLTTKDVQLVWRSVSSETDIAMAIRKGRADAGLALGTVAPEQGLGFVGLQWERFDLVTISTVLMFCTQ